MTDHPPPTSAPLDPFAYRHVGPVRLYLGDARRVLAAMPDASVDCLITSPPFWSLRDYGTGAWTGGNPVCPHPPTTRRRVNGTRCGDCGAVWVDPQYGLEPTVEDYVARLVAVFDQARRVLTPTGTCWLNLGDCYTDRTRRAYDTDGPIAATRGLPGAHNSSPLPAKNLVGVPWRVAFALQTSGWILRNANVWSKTNPMPESVGDRLSTTYEVVFLLTRSPAYYFDLDPIRIPLKHPDAADGSRVIGGVHKGHLGGVGATERRRGARYDTPATGKYRPDATDARLRAHRGSLAFTGHAHTAGHRRGRNPGDVWTLPTRPYRGAHTAPFPVDIPLRAIAAGCPPGGHVLDPFSRAGTTGLAALRLGRRFTGVDINAGFHDQALQRLAPHLPGRGG